MYTGQSHNHEKWVLVVQMRDSQHKVCNVRLDIRVCSHTVQNVFVTWSTQSHVHDMTLSLVGPFGCMDLCVCSSFSSRSVNILVMCLFVVVSPVNSWGNDFSHLY